MRELLFNRLTLIWALLVAATALSWAMGRGLDLHDRRVASVAIIGVAVLKARYVILDFMELRGAPLFSRLVSEAWIIVLGAAMTGFICAAGDQTRPLMVQVVRQAHHRVAYDPARPDIWAGAGASRVVGAWHGSCILQCSRIPARTI